MAKKRTFLLTVAVAAVLLWATDAFIASATSPTVTKKCREALDANPGIRVTFAQARLHPVFLSLELDDLGFFDAAPPGARILYAAHVVARPDIGSWFLGRRDFSELTLEGASVRIVKDWQGTFNVERAAHPGKTGGGWKHQDWLYNLYERLKRSAGGAATAYRNESVFKIGRLHVRGRAVLTDHRMKPLVLRNFEARVRELRVTKAGTVEFDALNVRGAFRGTREGRFDADLTRAADELHAVINLKNFDLAPLLPLYRSSSPVFFDKGFVTLHSDTRFTADKIDSRNHLRIDDYAMRPAVSWSPASTAVLHALNRHPFFDARFSITGHPDHPSVEGLADALVKALEGDFDRHTLAIVRIRVQQEVEKIESGLGR